MAYTSESRLIDTIEIRENHITELRRALNNANLRGDQSRFNMLCAELERQLKCLEQEERELNEYVAS